jgi:tetratricopeptide (TPR) repeat protein
LELAEVYERLKQPEKALALYAKFPDDAAVQERRGVLSLARGDLPTAIESLEAAKAKSPTPAVLYALATAYLRNKQVEKSLPLAQSLVAAEPTNLEMRLFYGRMLRDQKQYEEAAKQFSAVVNLKKDSLEGWNELTGMLILLKKYDIALTALERSKALGGETPAYFFFRATMFDALGDAKQAYANYQKFLSVSDGKFPDEEWKARHRAKFLEKAVK